MIFISHAWTNDAPDHRVLQFVNFLRENGYEAECDVMYQQTKPSIHFTEMMAKALKEAEKTIIVLSRHYKLKADDFRGGVGTEYRYIIDDFSRNENRYILVSFDGRSSDIIPDFLNGRDIIDLKIDESTGYRELFSKLSGMPKIEFSPVSKQKTIPQPLKMESFKLNSTESLSQSLNLDFSIQAPLSDLDKKKFLKEAYSNITSGLRQLSEEVCSVQPYFHIEQEQIDSVTTIYEIYNNESKIRTFQIWFGSMFGSSQNGIFIGESIGNKNSFNEMITCQEENGEPVLHFIIGRLFNTKNLSTNETIKYLWENYFQIYLRKG